MKKCLTKNVSVLTGDVSGLRGSDVSDLRGDIDNAGLTEKQRAKGVNIGDLIK